MSAMDITVSDDMADGSQDAVPLSITATDSELDYMDDDDDQVYEGDVEADVDSELEKPGRSEDESLLDTDPSTTEHQHSDGHDHDNVKSDHDDPSQHSSDACYLASPDVEDHAGPRVVAEMISQVQPELVDLSDDVHDTINLDTNSSNVEGTFSSISCSDVVDVSSILATTATSQDSDLLDHNQYQHLETTATASESDFNQSESALVIDLSGAETGSGVEGACGACGGPLEREEEETSVDNAADKPDYGLKEIPSLKNIKSRFESTDYDEADQAQSSTPVRRSESIITKMAKFQGLQSPENGNGEDSSSSSDEDMERDPEIIRESKHKEKTIYTQSAKTQDEVVTYSGMSELKSQWETGAVSTKEERARERQEELAKLRMRICQSKGNLKAKYESACEESSALKSPSHLSEGFHVNGETRTSSIKERFEKGDVVNDVENEKVERIQREKEEDLSVFKEQVSANDARNLFKQIDATNSKTGSVLTSSSYNNVGVLRSPSMRSKEVQVQSSTVTDGEIVRAVDKIDDDVLAPVDLTSRFKFFQNFNDSQNQQERKRFAITPPRDDAAPKESSPEPLAARDPSVVRADDCADDLVVTDTARKMLSKFRELESQAERGDDAPVGPKPLKRITPPREFTREGEGSPEPEPPRNPDIVRACDKVEDDFLIEAHKAKSLRAKFEHWDDENEVERENRRNAADELDPNADSAKSLKAKFEALKESDRTLLDNKPKPKVNRFIDLGGGANGELCDICGNRVYSMEKLEVNNHKVHKTCFRCSHCGTILRMDNYTTSEGVLFCTNHFKQLFIAKGNYDEGFGREQHKERWNKNSRSSTPNSALCETQYGNSDYSDE